MKQKIVLVIDCGATNIRTIAVNEKGDLLESASVANNTKPDPNYPQYLIWDIYEIWDKLCQTTKQVISKIDKSLIAGVTVTTFGVDGALVSSSGKILYPVISWACQRTAPIMDNIDKYIPLNKLYSINGLNTYSFNTINKLIWFNENHPEIIDKSKYFMFISSLLLFFLSGEFVTDHSMAGTSMLTDLSIQDFSDGILQAIHFNKLKFPPIAKAGEVIGKVTNQASRDTGIPGNTIVISAGHDTQFAIFGSGANMNEPILNSGTWEILMARTKSVKNDETALKNGVTTEFDAIPGVYNTGIQWLGSGVLEWLKQQFYQHEMNQCKDDAIYNIMINEAKKIDSSEIQISTDFLNNNGSIQGIGLSTKREEIYLAALHSLAHKTKESLKILEEAGNFKSKSIICVGGGSKNILWNQIRANALNIPVKLIGRKETTVLGAALFVFAGAGVYSSAEEARKYINYKVNVIEPK